MGDEKPFSEDYLVPRGTEAAALADREKKVVEEGYLPPAGTEAMAATQREKKAVEVGTRAGKQADLYGLEKPKRVIRRGRLISD